MPVKYPRTMRSAIRTWEKGYKMKSRILDPYHTKRGDGKIVLLKRNGRGTVKWDVLGVVQNFGCGWDSFRNTQTFEIATLREDFGANQDLRIGEAVKLATHLALIPQNEFYAIGQGDEREVIFINFIYRINAMAVGDKFTEAELEAFYA